MVTSNAVSSFGVILQRGDTPIAEITSIDGVEVRRDTIDVTPHGAADGYRQYIPGLKDSSEVAVEGNFIYTDEAGQGGLMDDLELGTLQEWTLIFPPTVPATWHFDAYVVGFKVGAFPIDDKISFSATLKISGRPHLVVGY